jgi:hypothetical protein
MCFFFVFCTSCNVIWTCHDIFFFLNSFFSILNKLTPEKFDVLKGQLIDTGIATLDMCQVARCICVKSAK